MVILSLTYIFCDPYLLNTAADVTITRTNGTPEKYSKKYIELLIKLFN